MRLPLLACLTITLIAASTGALTPAAAQDESRWARHIDAGTIAVLSDGDFEAHTYATGRLADPAAGWRDTLTVLRRGASGWSRSSIEVSNSVTAAPEVLRLSPDGRVAFVTERLAQRTAEATRSADLAPGRRLFAVATEGEPRLLDTAWVEPHPEALDVSPDGRHVAVVSNTPEASYVQIVRFDGARFAAVSRFRVDTLGVEGRPGTPRHGITATNVQWHPSGRALAVNLNTLDRVLFVRVALDGDRVELQPWGAAVPTGRDPFVGRFTPDGRHYLTADWGRDFAATTLEGRLPTQPSSVGVIRLAEPGARPAQAQHRRLGHVPTDLSSEGLAVSPDGRWVATVNMRGTALPADSARFDHEASVTLLRFDAAAGRLAKVAEHRFAGVLPEGASFDRSSQHLLVTVFQYPAGQQAGGGLEVFGIGEGEPAGLRHLGRLALPHGAHHVDVAR